LVSQNYRILCLLNEKKQKQNMLLFYRTHDSIQINKRFFVLFSTETKMKLQLTTDMKSDFGEEATLGFSKFTKTQ